MKKPRFGLLLDLALAEEATARQAVANLLAQAAIIEEAIVFLDTERRSTADGGLAWREQWSAWWLRVDRDIAAYRQRLARIEADIDTARSRLAETHRQVRTWERLRERDTATILQAAERQAARELDDLGLARRGDR